MKNSINNNRFFTKILVFIKTWVYWSRENPTNFAKFVITSASITLLVRYAILKNFAAIPPILNKLLIIATLSTLLSIFIFYIKFYYSDNIKSMLKPVVNLQRISSNIDKRAYMMGLVKEHNPELKLWVIHLILPLLLIFIYFDVSEQFKTPFMLFISLLFIAYASYMLKIRNALIYLEVPLDKLPVPPTIVIKWWYLTYMIKTKVGIWVRGPRVNGGTVLKVSEYVSTLEFQRKVKTAAVTTTAISAVFAGIVGIEASICHLADRTTPSYMLISSALRGFYTPYPKVRQQFSEICHAIPKDKLKTFVIPGTSELDPNAVGKAYKKLTAWENDYSVDSPMPRLEGPHKHKVIPVESKEMSTSDILSFE